MNDITDRLLQKTRELSRIHSLMDKNEDLREWGPVAREVYGLMDKAQALINNRDATKEDNELADKIFNQINKRRAEVDAEHTQRLELHEKNMRNLLRQSLRVRKEIRQLEKQYDEEQQTIMYPEKEVEFFTGSSRHLGQPALY